MRKKIRRFLFITCKLHIRKMIIIWLILGLVLPATSGWLILRILEWKTPVLFRFERWALGFLLGLTLTVFVTFVVHTALGMALTFKGYLIVQVGLTFLLSIIWIPIRKTTPKIENRNCQLSIVNCS